MILVPQLILTPLALEDGVVHLVIELVETLHRNTEEEDGVERDARGQLAIHHLIGYVLPLLVLGHGHEPLSLLLHRYQVHVIHRNGWLPNYAVAGAWRCTIAHVCFLIKE